MGRLCLVSIALLLAASESMAATVRVTPAETRQVKGERLNLSTEPPKGWRAGTRLAQLCTLGPGQGTTAPGALDPDSVVLRHNGRVLERDRDYLLDAEWGGLGLAPNSSIGPDDEVEADYSYSLLRIDSQVRLANGIEVVVQGVSDLTTPVPPVIPAGARRLANLLVGYHSDGSDAVVFPIKADAPLRPILTTPGRIPRTLAKLKAGEPVHIVCWGDSVTAGGDASRAEHRFPKVLERRLREQFPQAQVKVTTIAVGGSQSQQWLYPGKFTHPRPERVRFEQISEAKPDLVTVEFVNDAYMDAAQVDRVYGDILQRLHGMGAEVILITPHFTSMRMMGFKSMTEPERRPYVLALRAFANSRGIALADAAGRWENLANEGISYITLLKNGLNHPDDRGHAIFADELIKCFSEQNGRPPNEASGRIHAMSRSLRFVRSGALTAVYAGTRPAGRS